MILIEVLHHPNHNSWKLFNRADSMEEAREIAAKAILKTNYLAVRIRDS
jgi:pyruvate-formate lyase-activating enzyme